MAVNSFSLDLSKSSIQKKVSQMNLAVAQNAVLQEKLKTETVADSHVHNVKCSLQYVQLAAKAPQFLSNQPAISPYIAVTATNHVPETTGKKSAKTLSVNERVFLIQLIYC